MTQSNSKPGSQSSEATDYERSDVNPRLIATVFVAMLVTLSVIVFSVWGVVIMLWQGGQPPRPPLTVSLPSMSQHGGAKGK